MTMSMMCDSVISSSNPDETLGVAGRGSELVSSLEGFLALGKLLRHDIPENNNVAKRRKKMLRLSIETTSRLWFAIGKSAS